MKLIKKIIKRIPILCMVFVLCGLQAAQAFEAFTAKSIEIKGLHRIERGTVLNYLPVRAGERVTSADTAHFIRALYHTGFFTNVTIDRRGNVLVVNVTERATINSVSVSGNKDIPKEKFFQVLRDVGIVKGRVYNQSVIESVKQELKGVYNAHGKYNSHIDIHVKDLSRNRVAIDINIHEGSIAKIKEINIIGNSSFATSTLLGELPISSSGLFTFLSHKDEYTREKLRASEEALKAYYMNRGYIKMKVQSAQVTITPDRRQVYITIKINEGGHYTFSGFRFVGQTILPKPVLNKLVLIRPGAGFSRQVVVSSVSAISDALGTKGYGFPLVTPVPKFDEKNKTVFVNINIKPGAKVYVRRINFVGNTRTADTVLRHAMRQQEAEKLNLSKIRESERQLRVLPYLKGVKVTTHAVPNSNNQVDLHYHVEEENSAKFMLQFGYSTAEKFLISASISEPNFLGSGRNVNLSFSNSRASRNYRFSYFDPYYGEYGLGRGYNLYVEQQTLDKLRTISPYNNDRYGGGVFFRYLLSDHNSFSFGAGFEQLKLKRVSPNIIQYNNFVTRYGKTFNEIRFTGSWNHDSYDTMPFPTRGLRHQLSGLVAAPAFTNKSLKYYKFTYMAHYYHPLIRGFIFSLRGAFAYGNGYGDTDGLPFYENFFGGGIGSFAQVRGYETYSLGPRDFSARHDPIGGNMAASGSAALILPYPFSRSTLRTSVFFDIGNVYNRRVPIAFQGSASGPLRYSAGLGVEWQSPFGPLQFSLGWPIKKQSRDRREGFQFSLSTGL